MSWISAAKLDDIPTGTGKRVIVNDQLIALFNTACMCENLAYAVLGTASRLGYGMLRK
jgi:nitrite reductase/ring-hydroxylating ferredoxin subunit